MSTVVLRGAERRFGVGAALACALTLMSSGALADPQLSVAATVGGGAVGVTQDPSAAFELGAVADLLLFRSGPRDMGVGPFATFETLAFDKVGVAGGLEWLLPTGGATALVLGVGGGTETSARGLIPRLSERVFWGSRSYNYHSILGVSLGLFAEAHEGLGNGGAVDVFGGVQIDTMLLALPIVFVVEALR